MLRKSVDRSFGHFFGQIDANAPEVVKIIEEVTTELVYLYISV